jgi:hypothetical protein
MSIEQLRKKYKYIVAWGIYTGSFGYYIDEQLLRAEADSAPANALYKGSISGVWVTFDEAGEHARNAVNYIIQDRGL